MEFLSKGSLDTFLEIEQQRIQVADLLSMARHAAAGMAYLEERNIVHRDLALRNLLVAVGEGNERLTIKISDFGLSRVLREGLYKRREGSIPIRWCAPEVLNKGIFTSKSDVWAFGVVLWEMFSYGKLPFAGMANEDVAANVQSGYRLPAPNKCPEEVYALILKCWNANPQARPTFKKLFEEIEMIRHDALNNSTSSLSKPPISSEQDIHTVYMTTKV